MAKVPVKSKAAMTAAVALESKMLVFQDQNGKYFAVLPENAEEVPTNMPPSLMRAYSPEELAKANQHIVRPYDPETNKIGEKLYVVSEPDFIEVEDPRIGKEPGIVIVPQPGLRPQGAELSDGDTREPKTLFLALEELKSFRSIVEEWLVEEEKKGVDRDTAIQNAFLYTGVGTMVACAQTAAHTGTIAANSITALELQREHLEWTKRQVAATEAQTQAIQSYMHGGSEVQDSRRKRSRDEDLEDGWTYDGDRKVLKGKWQIEYNVEVGSQLTTRVSEGRCTADAYVRVGTAMRPIDGGRLGTVSRVELTVEYTLDDSEHVISILDVLGKVPADYHSSTMDPVWEVVVRVAPARPRQLVGKEIAVYIGQSLKCIVCTELGAVKQLMNLTQKGNGYIEAVYAGGVNPLSVVRR